MPGNLTEWTNQNGLTEYPLTRKFFLSNLLVDASFQQFNNFQPILNSVSVTNTNLIFNLTYDTGTQSFSLTNVAYSSGITFVRLFASSRYIGKLILGDGATTLWNQYVGQTININIPFAPTTVKSINSNNGVYSLNSAFGYLTLNAADDVVFYNTNQVSSNEYDLTFNAVKNHVLPTTPVVALKQINLIPPINNNIYIADSTIFKVQPGVGSINFNLIGSQVGTNNIKLVNTANF